MKTKYDKATGTWSITGISDNERNAMLEVLESANSLCFNEQEDSGYWYSGDGFVCTLEAGERKALRDVCKKL